MKLLQNIQLPTWLVVQMSNFLINNSEDKIHGLTPFEVIYLRGNKFPTNIPSLSISKPDCISVLCILEDQDDFEDHHYVRNKNCKFV